MAEELNATYITFGGYVELEKYRYVYFVIIFIMYILIICSNFTIICLIWIHQNLHEPMYIFIAALLLNSLLLSTVIYPKILVDIFSEKQIISYWACLTQYFIFYLLVASEFLLLTVMAYDRYVSICKPLQYPHIMTKTTVIISLALAWLFPVCVIVVPVILNDNQKFCSFTVQSIFCNNSIHRLHCVPSRTLMIYGIIALITLAIFPLIFILFTYKRIFIITYQSCKDVRQKAAQTCLPHLLVLINYSLLITYNVVVIRLESDMPKTAYLIMTLQLVLYHPLFNPIIYGLKMTEISKHLKKLFRVPKVNEIP